MHPLMSFQTNKEIFFNFSNKVKAFQKINYKTKNLFKTVENITKVGEVWGTERKLPPLNNPHFVL